MLSELGSIHSLLAVSDESGTTSVRAHHASWISASLSECASDARSCILTVFSDEGRRHSRQLNAFTSTRNHHTNIARSKTPIKIITNKSSPTPMKNLLRNS